MRVSKENNKSSLKSFSISGLFNSQDVFLEFDKDVIILIGDNGLGKTTILNALYYTISCNFHKLKSISFESITVKFKSEEEAYVPKASLRLSSLPEDSKYVRRILYKLPNYVKEELQRLAETRDKQSLYDFINRISRDYDISPRSIREILDLFGNNPNIFDNGIDEAMKIIKKNIHEDILYFPTYRRIEEDLKNLGYSQNSEEYKQIIYSEETPFRKVSANKQLIQFGMDDVIAKLDSLTSAIDKEVKQSVSEITNGMLSQLVGETQITDEMKDSIKQSDALSIVLNRVGDKLREEDKQNITELVKSDSFYTSGQHNLLIYLLSRLVTVYEQQRKKDDSIRKFVSACNSYLQTKKVVYDEDAIKVSVIQVNTNKTISLSSLSSGEKQIVSLFANIHLDSSGNFILLFDEPELSLSVEWQQRLLPDILNSERCNLLLAVTHSPFIFDNELDENARDLQSFVSER